MFGRRILVLVAVLMGLTALAATLAPPPQTLRRPGPTAAPTPGATAAPAPSGEPRVVSAHLSATSGATAREVTAARGDTVRLRVTGDVLDTVVVGELVAEPIERDSPADVELFADAPGRYPIRLLESGRRIGALRITAG